LRHLRLDLPQFLGAMGLGDVPLDPVGWPACTVPLESRVYNLPICTRRGPLMRGRYSAAIVELSTF
jgi:hypothetical protein